MPIYKMKGNKDGKQKYRVRINYVDNLGSAKQLDRVAYGSAEAKELEMKLLYEVKREKPAAKITVGQLYDKYTEAVKADVRETTLNRIESVCKNHILPYMKNKPLNKLTAPVLQDWKTIIANKDISITTKKNIYAYFLALLNWAVKLDYLQTNPLQKLGNFKTADKTSHQNISFYTSDEYLKFAEAAKEYAKEKNTVRAYDYYVFFSIAFYCGLRKGEISALKWSDIDGEYMHITRSIAQKLKGKDRETPPKNRSSVRTLQIPKPLLNILSEHKKRCKQYEKFSEDLRICGGALPLRDTTVEKMNKRFAESAGLKKIRIHDFRHSHVSLLANAGINIQEIARRLGHSDIKMTWNTYAHLYPKEEEKAVEVLNKIV